MERAERSFSWNKQLLAAAVSAGLVTGCATTARDLPQDYSSVTAQRKLRVEDFAAAPGFYRYNKTLSVYEPVKAVELMCAEIDEELKSLESDSVVQNQDVVDKRLQNQVVGYIGAAFFPPILLVIDNSSDAKDRINSINRAKDELYKLRAFKKCSASK